MTHLSLTLSFQYGAHKETIWDSTYFVALSYPELMALLQDITAKCEKECSSRKLPTPCTCNTRRGCFWHKLNPDHPLLL
jgi:hypothetical protein